MVVYTGPPDSPEYGKKIIDELRRVIKDTSYESPQFELQVSGDASSVSAFVEISDNHFITTIGGSTTLGLAPHIASPMLTAAGALDLDLTAGGPYDTIEKLVNHIQSVGGYLVAMVEDGDPNHSCTDMRMMPPTDIVNKPFVFKTRRWADSELSTAVDRAVGRHNLSVPLDPTLNYNGPHTADTVPQDHIYFIILLAQIELLKMLVQDALKRRGTDMSATDYDLIKRTLEEEYDLGLKRFLDSRRSPIPSSETEDMGSGDIIVGHSYREALRSPAHGQWVRDAVAPGPSICQLMATPLPNGRVLLQWQHSRDVSFWKYEVWRSTTPMVSNISDYVRPAGAIPPQGVRIRLETMQSTGQWVDGASPYPLAPNTYYYRLYVFNRNGKTAEGDVVEAIVEPTTLRAVRR